MSSHQGLTRQLSVLSVLLIIAMGGVVAFPSHSMGPFGDLLGGAKVTGLQLGNSTSTSSLAFSNSTTSSTTLASSTSHSVSTTTSSSATSVRSTSTNSTTFVTTSFNSTSTHYTSSTTTSSTSTNSSITFHSTNSTSFTTSTAVNSTATTNSTTSVTSVQNVTKWDPYADFYHFLNWGLFNQGGDCYGFASTAILYFRHYALGDMTYPYYPEPTSSVSSLPGQTGKYCLFNQCLEEGDTLYQSTFPIYIHQTYQTYELSQDFSQPTLQSSLDLLRESISAGIPVLLALGPTDGHAVVAWGYSQTSSGSMTIDISDPNYGNTPRYAYYSGGAFSYIGSASWSSFYVITPGNLQSSWFSLQGNWASQWGTTVDQTNPYYNFVFSDGPAMIVSTSGTAYFNGTGDSLTFSSSISGVVGFEEGVMEAYAIPKDVTFTISDPGQTSSFVTIVVPQNSTSLSGYQVAITSSSPLSVTIQPTNATLKLVTSTDIQSSVSFFTVGQGQHSLLTASSIPVGASQTALFTVPDWGKLNSTTSAASLQVFSTGSNQPVTSITLTNGQPGTSKGGGLPGFILPAVIIVAAIALGSLLFVYARRHRGSP